MIPALIRMADDYDRRADALDAEARTLPRELSGHPRGALRQQPAAAYGEDAIEGPGDPLCRDCARRTTSCPEYARYIDDGGAVETPAQSIACALALGAGLYALAVGVML